MYICACAHKLTHTWVCALSAVLMVGCTLWTLYPLVDLIRGHDLMSMPDVKESTNSELGIASSMHARRRASALVHARSASNMQQKRRSSMHACLHVELPELNGNYVDEVAPLPLAEVVMFTDAVRESQRRSSLSVYPATARQRYTSVYACTRGCSSPHTETQARASGLCRVLCALCSARCALCPVV